MKLAVRYYSRGGNAKMIAEKKIPVAKEEFSCRGAFAMLHKGRPNEEDQKAAADFARGILS